MTPRPTPGHRPLPAASLRMQCSPAQARRPAALLPGSVGVTRPHGCTGRAGCTVKPGAEGRGTRWPVVTLLQPPSRTGPSCPESARGVGHRSLHSRWLVGSTGGGPARQGSVWFVTTDMHAWRAAGTPWHTGAPGRRGGGSRGGGSGCREWGAPRGRFLWLRSDPDPRPRAARGGQTREAIPEQRLV